MILYTKCRSFTLYLIGFQRSFTAFLITNQIHKMRPILEAHRTPITFLAEEFFKTITQLPREIRPDDKERTGVKLFLREINTDNILMLSILNPSERAQFFSIEKAVRSATLLHAASQNSENPDKMEFAGSITITLEDGSKFQSSTSGLKAPEDVGLSIVTLAYAVQWSTLDVINNVRKNGGKLPSFLSDQQHYMRKVFAY